MIHNFLNLCCSNRKSTDLDVDQKLFFLKRYLESFVLTIELSSLAVLILLVSVFIPKSDIKSGNIEETIRELFILLLLESSVVVP